MKNIGVGLLGLFIILLLCGTAPAWQGRMAGMGNPYGLVADESDLLIHPAEIAAERGTKYFATYRFDYQGTSDWTSHLDLQAAPGSFADWKSSGDNFNHNVLIGTIFPLYTGRSGVFFSYSGTRSDISGNETMDLTSTPFDMKHDSDNFGLRFLYGRPINNALDVGGELAISRTNEDNRLAVASDINPVVDPLQFPLIFFPTLFPHDSNVWQISPKLGIVYNCGPTKVSLTAHGGASFAGDNEWQSTDGFTLQGNDETYNAGADLWVRYRYANNLSLPFVLSVNYRHESWDGSQDVQGFASESSQRQFKIEAGGGADYHLTESTRVAAGLYYDYLQDRNSLSFSDLFFLTTADYDGYPKLTQHLARFKIAAEKVLNSTCAVRAGMNVFAGAAEEDRNFSVFAGNAAVSNRSALDGTHWGITGYLGATTKYQRATIEAFMYGGYEELHFGTQAAVTETNFIAPISWDLRQDLRQPVAGAGISILF